MTDYPLAGKWRQMRERITDAPPPQPTGVDRQLYLDLAERIVRAAVAWIDDAGVIIDPYTLEPDHFATARFVGAVGHLLAAGRCEDLIPQCVATYQACLPLLHEWEMSPEFWVKEMMYAHAALRTKLPPERIARWERAWARHDPRASYNCIVRATDHNFNVFALAGEFFKWKNDLADHRELIEELLAGQRRRFTDLGMYRDPADPMTYDLVVRMQLDLLMSYGYAGRNLDWIREVSRRGALTSLMMQSVTGQAPFGGRSNQFHFVEAHFACMCESQARFHRDRGDVALAGAFKRAGRRAIAMTAPWVLDMTPFRQTKQGFDPALNHGIDSGGHYSVYGLLMAGLCATAYHLADEGIEERMTPAEIGGCVFDIRPAFHKVFATCAGYHLQIDTRADLQKDATGLGRLQREGVWPETALSGSITATPGYSFAFRKPARNLAIGPAWLGDDGREQRLASFSETIDEAVLEVIEETEERVVFEVTYTGELGGVERLVERYDLGARGLHYSVRAEPNPPELWLLVPVIHSDGAAESRVAQTAEGLDVAYRGAIYEIRGPGARITHEPPSANRNALYHTARIDGSRVRLELRPHEG